MDISIFCNVGVIEVEAGYGISLVMWTDTIEGLNLIELNRLARDFQRGRLYI